MRRGRVIFGAALIVISGMVVGIFAGRGAMPPSAPRATGPAFRGGGGAGRPAKAAAARPRRVDRSPAADRGSDPLRTLERMGECWRTDSCGASDADPRANHFEAVAVIKDSLNRLRSLKRSGVDSDFSGVAGKWLAFPDDHVREAALGLAREHKRSEEILRALLAGLRESLSAPLFAAALADLGAYQRMGYDREIAAFLVETLRSGPLKAGEAIAAGILPLLTEGNEALFAETAASLPGGSRARRDLESALEEFERLRSGG